MRLKTEQSLEQCIDSEKDLDNCIKQLESSNILTSCSLHFTMNDLPLAKMNQLTELIGKQIRLDTLILTADVSLYYSKVYAIILQKVFTELNHLTVLIFRGLYSSITLKTLIPLVQKTKSLSKLSVGAYYPGQESYAMTERGGARFAKALKKNSTLTHLDLQGNKLNESGVATLINSLRTHDFLKTLKLSDNIDSPNKYIKNYSGEGILRS